jgi:hypothetical protein
VFGGLSDQGLFSGSDFYLMTPPARSLRRAAEFSD